MPSSFIVWTSTKTWDVGLLSQVGPWVGEAPVWTSLHFVCLYLDLLSAESSNSLAEQVAVCSTS